MLNAVGVAMCDATRPKFVSVSMTRQMQVRTRSMLLTGRLPMDMRRRTRADEQLKQQQQSQEDTHTLAGYLHDLNASITG